MRAITAAQQGVVDSGVQAEFVRVSIKDAGGTFRDLTTYPGFDAVKSVQWRADVSSPCATFECTLARELFQLSLNPFVDNGVNRSFDPAVSFAPLIQANREVKIECAVVAMDTQPLAGDWMEVFRGQVENVDAASGWDVHVTGSDLAGRLAKQYVKLERVYSFAVDAGVPKSARQWAQQMVVVAGEYLIPASRGNATATTPANPGYNKILKCHTGGTTGLVEPVWTTGALQADGATVKWDYVGAPSVAGFPLENIIQQILDDNRLTGDPAVTLLTPVSPGWNITQFAEPRGFTLDGVRALATQIGWDLRYKWDAGSGVFRFTLYVPVRSSPSVDHTFATRDYQKPTRLSIDIASIRNSVRVIYADKADLYPDGTPKRKVIDVADAASIAKYGQELWMELQEDQTGNIDSSTEATTLANAALSDCSEPTAELAVPLARAFPWTELCDYYKFTANGLHFTSDQSLAVTAATQTFEGGHLKTTLELRGNPTISAAVHLDKEFHPNGDEKMTAHRQQQFQGAVTASISIADTVGGQSIKIQIDKNGKNALLGEYEVHVYPTPGTTLDASTMAGLSTSQNFSTGDLIPGKQYYGRVVPRYYNAGRLVRGEPSAEVGFVAGRASAGHLRNGIALGDYPLNGGFETRLDTMPDHWVIEPTFGVYGTDVQVMEDGNGISGGRYLRVNGKVAGDVAVDSAQIPVVNEAGEANRTSQMYRFTLWVKNATGNAAGFLEVFLGLYDYAGAFITQGATLVVDCTTKKTHWVKYELYVTVDGTTAVRSALVTIDALASGSSAYTVDIDEVRLQWVGSPWYEIGATTKFTERYVAIPGFTNAWVNFDAGTHATAAFRWDRYGKLQLKGLIKSGAIGASAFTLPVAPQQNRNYAVDSNGAHGRVEIDTSGHVTPLVGNNAWVSLDGLEFDIF